MPATKTTEELHEGHYVVSIVSFFVFVVTLKD